MLQRGSIIKDKELNKDHEQDFYSEYEKELIQKVEEITTLMENNLLFSGSRTPTFDELNRAMLGYEPILFKLITIYNKVKMNLSKANDDYDMWFSEKFIEVKEELNRKDNKSTWYSAKELECTVKSRYKDDFLRLRAAVAKAESERSFVQRMISAWESYQFILSQLSKNSIAEANVIYSSLQGKSSLVEGEF